jgi:hypothetical protein
MSIRQLREEGFADLTMRYDEGGAVQVFTYKGKEFRFPGSATMGEVAEALRKSEQDDNARVG